MRQNLQVFLGAEVLAARLKQMEIMRQRLPFQCARGWRVGRKPFGRCPEPHIDMIYIFNQLHDLRRIQKIRQPPAESGRKVEFSVRKGSRAAKAAHGAANLAGDAFPHLSFNNRAFPCIYIAPLIAQNDFHTGVVRQKLIARINSRFSAADNGCIVYVFQPNKPMAFASAKASFPSK